MSNDYLLSMLDALFASVVVVSVSQIAWGATIKATRHYDIVVMTACLGLWLMVLGAAVAVYESLALREVPPLGELILHVGLAVWNSLVVSGTIVGTGQAVLGSVKRRERR